MATINLVDVGFSLIPEGVHEFKITNVNYKETFGKIEVEMLTKSGQKHIERFTLKNGKKVNEKAIKAFSFFAKSVMNDFSLDAIDHEDLVGRFFTATVEHVKSEGTNKETGEVREYTNVRLSNYGVCDGFTTDEDDETDEIDDLEDVDLDDLLDE